MREFTRLLAIVIGMTLVLGAAGASPGPDDIPRDGAAAGTRSDPGLQFFRQRLAAAHALVRDDNAAGADRAFHALIDDRQFDTTLAPSDQRLALSTAAWMAVLLDEHRRATQLYARAIAIDDGDPDDWYRLSLVQFDLGEYDASATTFVHLAERWPELLPNVGEDHIHRLRWKLTPPSPVRLEFLQALFDANWTSKTGGASAIWYDLALAQAARGDESAARAAMKRIDSPMDLVRLRSDKRFDALVDPDAWAFNVEHAARQQVEALQVQAQLAPEKLDIQTQVMAAMLAAGMNAEAVELADTLKARIAEAPAGQPYTDIGEQVWLMNYRAIALRRLGRTAEALEELVHASGLTEKGQINVSQALNLGAFQCSLGRPDDALEAIAEVGNMSGYGRMVQQAVLHCAALAKDDRRGASKALAYLRSHRKDGQFVYLEALLRAGQLNQAAQTVDELLASADDRGDMLEWFQEYVRPAPLPGDVRSRAARAALLARPDIQDAVARSGRIGRYGIYGPTDMD